MEPEPLRTVRKRLGFSREALAAKSGVSYPTIARIESGGKPGGETMLAIARALNVPVESIDWNFTSDDDDETTGKGVRTDAA